jgi:hypothetical protein
MTAPSCGGVLDSDTSVPYALLPLTSSRLVLFQARTMTIRLIYL